MLHIAEEFAGRLSEIISQINPTAQTILQHPCRGVKSGFRLRT